jgi:ribonuclease III
MDAARARRAQLERLEQRLGHRFADRTLLETALTHRSHAYETGLGPAVSYERLEFLGDAVLGFVVSESLYREDPDADEGALSRRRQAVVRTEALAELGRELGLAEAIRLGRGEERAGGGRRPGLLSDVFEALLAAVYLDGGIRAARACIKRHLGPVIRATRQARGHAADAKTRLQEIVQGRLHRTPRYRIVSKTGPDHETQFEVEVRVGPEVMGCGTGSNRKRAEQAAARAALAWLGQTEE